MELNRDLRDQLMRISIQTSHSIYGVNRGGHGLLTLIINTPIESEFARVSTLITGVCITHGGKYLRLYSRVSHCEIRKIEVHCIETAKAKRKEKAVSSGFSELTISPCYFRGSLKNSFLGSLKSHQPNDIDGSSTSPKARHVTRTAHPQPF